MGETTSSRSECLRRAVIACKVKTVKFFLWNGADVNVEDKIKRTALHLACECPEKKAKRVVNLLLMSGANVNARTVWGATHLHLACLVGNAGVVETLLTHGARTDVVDDEGMTPLHVLAYSKTPDVPLANTLLMSGANVNARTVWGATPLHLACLVGNAGVVETLLTHGARPDIVDDEGVTPLHVLAYSETPDVSLAYTLLKYNAPVGAVDSRRRTPLHYFSCRPGRTKSVLAILNNGGNVNLKDSTGDTPLHLACQFNISEVVSLYLEAGAYVEARNCDGMTPLHSAALTCAGSVVSVMVEHVADVNAQDNRGNTPLHLACTFNNSVLDYVTMLRRRELVEELLRHGASVNSMNDRLRTPYDASVLSIQLLKDQPGVNNDYEVAKRMEILQMITKEHIFRSFNMSSESCSRKVSSTIEPDGFNTSQRRSTRIKENNESTKTDVGMTPRVTVLKTNPSHLPAPDLDVLSTEKHEMFSPVNRTIRMMFVMTKTATVQLLYSESGK